ncbi:hypothetical protein [Candidatus Chlorohelix sp.]|uniref:hypothetical protein n=1 Tax=Candidatus Chlorohelix sp. TaxID=3139201 RepID=UPI00302AEBEB
MQKPHEAKDILQAIQQPFTPEAVENLNRTMLKMLNQKTHLIELRQKALKLSVEQKGIFNIAVAIYNSQAEQLRFEGWSVSNLEMLLVE